MKKKYFFGWTNIKWLIKEIGDIYSNEESYFSKKRIESGIAFAVAEFGMMYYFITNINKMDIQDLGIWAAIQFAVAGYVINQIQKEKKTNSDNTSDDTTQS